MAGWVEKEEKGGQVEERIGVVGLSIVTVVIVRKGIMLIKSVPVSLNLE